MMGDLKRRVIQRLILTFSLSSNPQVAKSKWIREGGAASEHGMLIAPLPADGEVGSYAWIDVKRAPTLGGLRSHETRSHDAPTHQII
jgi:hypothetical protein